MALVEATVLVHDTAGASTRTRVETGRRAAPRSTMIAPSEPIVVAADPARAMKALARLAVGCLRFAPIAAVDGDHGILLDIRGCDRWLSSRGGESGLLDRIETTFRRAGFAVRTAIADTVVAARAWAVWRPAAFPPSPSPSSSPPSRTPPPRVDPRRVPSEAIWSALDPLPVECLELDVDVVDRLHQVNVRRVGELRRLPRTALPARYGPVLHRRLDQAVGRGGDAFVEARVVPVRPADRVLASRTFAGPVRSAEAIELAMVDLVGELHDRLQTIAAGARILRIVAERVDAPDWIDQVELARATRRPSHLWSVLEPLVQRLPLDVGIDTLALEAARHRRLRDRSAPIVPGAVDRAEDPHLEESFAAFVDLVQARFGGEAMRRFDPTSGHTPEDRMRMRPFDASDERRTRRDVACGERGASEDSLGVAIRQAIAATGPRPTSWLDHPEEITVDIDIDIDGGRPVAIQWRGRRRAVTVASGPESIGAPWWRRAIVPGSGIDGAASTVVPRRDYWCVQFDGGGAIWVFRASSTGRWFVQGVWS